jgi:uncharacterized protein (TIGR03382 family)
LPGSEGGHARLVDPLLELATIVVIALIPTVPIAVLGWAFVRRRRRTAADVSSGRAPETPFAALTIVGLVITVAVVFILAATIAARWIA